MTSTIEEAVQRVLETVDYLAVDRGPLDDPGWVPCRGLLAEPELLSGMARSLDEEQGYQRRDQAMSLFVQGYAFRVASIAIGAWLMGGLVLDVSPEGMALGTGHGRPNRVRFDEYRSVDPPGMELLHTVLVDGHLAVLVETAHRATTIGRRLLWSNIGSACASSFGAFMNPERAGVIGGAVADFFATARPELRQSGGVVPVGPVWAWERRACCLWYQAQDGNKCADCSLWSADDRQERYARVLAEIGP